ncbi:MAG: hypothetical protein ACYTEZ_13575 [Planctomycetota bacterium]|jgi:hypothetical protein
MTLEQRVDQLERQNRWMRRIGAVGLALVAAVLLMGQDRAKDLPDLKVRSLTVRDLGGKERAALFTAADGSPFLTLADKDGTIRAMVSSSAVGAALNLYDKNGKTRARLGTAADGSPSLTLYDAKDKVIWKAPKE